MEQVDSIVIGAGVVGMACARALALAGREVIVIEKESLPGTGISARNSGVIHAGIYYPTGSLKAQLCLRGKDLLYDYCQNHAVPHRRCGKLIVATSATEETALENIRKLACANGVDDLRYLSQKEVAEREPALVATKTLLSPSTGIVDVHSLILAFQGDLENHSGMIAYNTPVLGGRVTDSGIVLETGGDSPMVLQAKTLINAAGLGAMALARQLKGLPEKFVPELYYAKGNYFSLPGKPPFRHLIYPVPEQAGLGVHVTLDLEGQVRFGPDVEWVRELDYPVDPARAAPFYAAIRRYWPDLPDNALAPDYSGIRPKLQAPGEAAVDFMIQGPATHDVPGLINLFGIESPGLTSSMAIAENVLMQLDLG
ncbi:NAD(P)/FAD-dependent oxidoreductase [Kiloniella laminariae]|uniref:NAD(P)/FAD-dependent oxidoreductase n=1 Tax=Kiloniella laminariae TaxID=454162 RepID=A0ABT4LDY7_9PROT|nr:NAD(P)/FAD-dependent oxidoreductase [Kiloniella laminariae]MCZ4279307.1 NAD(P)/FAD-dependent oxidoreductase [Kiloniella laminariae]